MTAIIDEVRTKFNAAQGTVRLISFLSPTCGPCRYGQGVVRELFDAFPAKELAGFIIWVPMLPADNAQTAAIEQDSISDVRLRLWFDEDRSAANAWSAFVGYPGTTWDVYAVYDRTAIWSDESPPPPRIWMHQLNETPATQLRDRLDTDRLAREWLALIGATAPSAEDLARRLHEHGSAVSSRPGE